MYSVMVLAIACFGLGYGLFAFAHGRLAGAEIAEWERLRASGLLPQANNLGQDFRTVTYLLQTIASAVEMPSEPWVRAYFVALRGVQLVLSSAHPVEQELRRLVAYQALQYRLACSRMAEITSE